MEEKVEEPVKVAPVEQPAPVVENKPAEEFVIKKVLKTMPDGTKKVVKVKVRVQPDAKKNEINSQEEVKQEPEKKLPFDPTVKEKGKRANKCRNSNITNRRYIRHLKRADRICSKHTHRKQTYRE